MLKAIVTIRRDDGTYDEVGMNHRTLFSGASMQLLKKNAAKFANGRPYRIEFFSASTFYVGDKPQSVWYSHPRLKEQS
jgi:hypothetical protein